MASYSPVSGINGGVGINSTAISADNWTASFNCNIMEAPSFTGAPWIEHCVGMKRGRYSMSGTWNSAYNPFAHSIKIGQSISFTAQITNSITANDSDALVEQWDITNYADGKCDYNCSIICDYIFGDFSGGNA